MLRSRICAGLRRKGWRCGRRSLIPAQSSLFLLGGIPCYLIVLEGRSARKSAPSLRFLPFQWAANRVQGLKIPCFHAETGSQLPPSTAKKYENTGLRARFSLPFSIRSTNPRSDRIGLGRRPFEVQPTSSVAWSGRQWQRHSASPRGPNRSVAAIPDSPTEPGSSRPFGDEWREERVGRGRARPSSETTRQRSRSG